MAKGDRVQVGFLMGSGLTEQQKDAIRVEVQRMYDEGLPLTDESIVARLMVLARQEGNPLYIPTAEAARLYRLKQLDEWEAAHPEESDEVRAARRKQHEIDEAVNALFDRQTGEDSPEE